MSCVYFNYAFQLCSLVLRSSPVILALFIVDVFSFADYSVDQHMVLQIFPPPTVLVRFCPYCPLVRFVAYCPFVNLLLPVCVFLSLCFADHSAVSASSAAKARFLTTRCVAVSLCASLRLSCRSQCCASKWSCKSSPCHVSHCHAPTGSPWTLQLQLQAPCCQSSAGCSCCCHPRSFRGSVG
jgi:hypothetical protein